MALASMSSPLVRILLIAAILVNVVAMMNTALAVIPPPINHVASGGWWNRRVNRGGRARSPAGSAPSSSSMRPMVNVPAGAEANPIVNQLRAYAVVTPILHENVNGQRTQAIVDQLAPGEHPDRMSYTVQAFDKTFVLHLEKSTDLFAPDYQEIRLAYDPQNPSAAPTEHVSESPVHCYYNARVEGDPSAVVSMSTCAGLRGHIRAYGEDLSIEPAAYSPPSGLNLQSVGGFSTSSFFSMSAFLSHPPAFTNTSHPVRHGSARHHAFPLSRISAIEHIVYRTQDLEGQAMSCGVSHDGLHPSAEHLSVPHEDDTDRDRVDADIDATPGPLVQPLMGTSPGQDVIELLVFNDYARWQSKGQGVEQDTLAIINSVKEWYKSTTFVRPTRVVLVGQVTFSEGDPFTADMTDSGVEVEGARGLLTVFHEYRAQAAARLPKHDNGQLFSEQQFTSNIMGLAGVGAMCSFYSGSITCMTGSALVTNSMISAHETGHTLSMLHDGSQGASSCPNAGFIMQTTTGMATMFSDCSISAADGFMEGSSSSCMQS